MINVLDTETLNKYMDSSLNYLSIIFPLVPLSELENALQYSIKKRFINPNIDLDNTYKKKKIEATLLQISEYILKNNPIITASGCLFKNHDDSVDPMAEMLESFLSQRGFYKNKMYEFPKGSALYNKYNLLQLLEKINANALYGAAGSSSSIFYNLYTASSITLSAQSAISTSEVTFESFLCNNVKFRSLDEVIIFIDNNIRDTTKFDIYKVIGYDVPINTTFSYLIDTCGHGYEPSEEDLLIIWNYLNQLPQEKITRLFFKNNLFAFMDLKIMKEYIHNILAILETPYLNPNKPPKEAISLLNESWELINEFVVYQHNYNDTIMRAKYLPRQCTIFMDTDSTCLHLDPWYHFVLNNINGNNYKIMNQVIDIFDMVEKDEFGDIEDIESPFTFVDSKDYDFYDQEVIDIQRAIKPYEIIPQDNLRYSIINIMCYFLDKLINSTMLRYTKYTNSYRGDQFCRLIMKNEYLFKRVMLTESKKNYASIIELQEGHKVPQTLSASLDIKGLALNKSTVNEATQNRLKKILYEDILLEDFINHIKVLKELAIFEADIIDSLKRSEKEFMKPNVVKPMSNYDSPLKIQGIKACYVWNELKDSNMDGFDFNMRNSIDILKININKTNISYLKESYPEKYDKIVNLMNDSNFKGGISSIAIPQDVNIPEWLLDFVDYKTIVNDNISNFNPPLESIGIYIGAPNNNYTNILQL